MLIKHVIEDILINSNSAYILVYCALELKKFLVIILGVTTTLD